ncbi:hypothetical protein [Stutzerimonas nitrititolerans]|uniref:hypothetical protein n=1 Tax=Stutzerimonas nitrititolerans TaxID=2482751 RepID=UPI0028AF0937|nr:hypothetical protein [Stutzerimonas nitrititolerans]
MPKYEVTRAWHGVQVGDVVEFEKLHPVLKANVSPIKGKAAELTPASPGAANGGDKATAKAPTKGDIAKRLKELEIQFDGRKSAEELAVLLPDGDPLKPKAE